MQHNPIISGSSEGVCPSGNIRRILSKFPDICRRSHFCHDRKVSSIRQWQSFGLCMRKQHFPFFKFMCTSRNYVLEDTAGFSNAGFFFISGCRICMNCVHICGKQKRESTSEKGSAFRFSGRNTAQENLEFLFFCVSWQESGCSVRESGELKSKGIPLWEKTPFWNI